MTTKTHPQKSFDDWFWWAFEFNKYPPPALIAITVVCIVAIIVIVAKR